MTAERRKVLDMLAAGKITPEEADQLLDRLGSCATAEGVPEGEASGTAAGKA